MPYLKIIIKMILLVVVFTSGLMAYFYQHTQQFDSVSLDSSVMDQLSGSDSLSLTTVIKPHSEQDIIDALLSTQGPVTVSGVHHSLGGRVAYPDGLFLDMSEFDEVLELDTEKKLITVQSGISWKKIQQAIDPHNLSIKIMQHSNDYSVGGSLSVNAHGGFVAAGPVINSVRSIRIILADGKVYEASREKNNALFYGAIGGYGGLGVIVQVTLELTDNVPLERTVKLVGYNEFNDYFKDQILNDETIVQHYALFYPPNYESLLDISWRKTDKPVTDKSRLQEDKIEPWWQSAFLNWKSQSPLLHRIQKNLIDPVVYKQETVVMRNLESSSNLRAAGFIDTSTSTMVMQEYQVPVKRFEIFVFNMRDIFKRHHVSISKVIISYLAQDHGGLMTAGAEHSFSFKIIYLQKKNKDSQKKMEQWTKELIDAAVSSNGSFILPYYIPGTNEQFERAYPGSDFFFALKLKADPDGRFNNLFWRQHLAGYREKQLKMNHLKTAMEKE